MHKHVLLVKINTEADRVESPSLHLFFLSVNLMCFLPGIFLICLCICPLGETESSWGFWCLFCFYISDDMLDTLFCSFLFLFLFFFLHQDTLQVFSCQYRGIIELYDSF